MERKKAPTARKASGLRAALARLGCSRCGRSAAQEALVQVGGRDGEQRALMHRNALEAANLVGRPTLVRLSECDCGQSCLAVDGKTVHRGQALGIEEARIAIEAALGEEGGRR